MHHGYPHHPAYYGRYHIPPSIRPVAGVGALDSVSTTALAWGALSTASMALSAYHGYRRNQHGRHPILMALGWGLLGSLFPVITPTVAVAQGYAKPKGR